MQGNTFTEHVSDAKIVFGVELLLSVSVTRERNHRARENAKLCYRRFFCASADDEEEQNSPAELAFLKQRNEKFEYDIDFDKDFPFYLCSKCHSFYVKAKVQNEKRLQCKPASITRTTSTMSVEMEDAEEYGDSSLEEVSDAISETVSIKLIIRKDDGKVLPGKWINVSNTSCNDFMCGVQEQISLIMAKKIKKTQYKLSYKFSSGNAASCTALSDAGDFERFIKDYNKNTQIGKETIFIVSFNKESDAKTTSKQKRRCMVSMVVSI